MIEWFNITDLKQIDNEDINFNVSLPSGIIKNDNSLSFFLEIARQELIDFLPNPDLSTLKKERNAMLAAIYEKWVNKTAPSSSEGDEIADFVQDFYSLLREAAECFEGLCLLIYYIKNETQGVYTAIYNFANNYGGFHARLQELEDRKKRTSKAGKQSAKKRLEAKEEAFALWQKLELHKYKDEYAKEQLLPIATKYCRTERTIKAWIKEFNKKSNEQCSLSPKKV